ncbi:MAG: PDZ domain-containing protein, partial [Planctomycetota bacterium]
SSGRSYEITATGFGNEVRLLVDTGDHGSGSLPTEVFDRAVRDRGLPTAPTLELTLAGCREIAASRVDMFRLGQYTHEGTIMDGSRMPTLGLGVLSDYAVAFDPANSLLHLRRTEACPRRDELGMSGLVLVRRKGRIVVYHVLSDTPASLAGIQSGDVVVTIDGKDAAGLRLYELSWRLSSCEGSRVSLVMERNGERKEVAIVLRRQL